MHGFLNIHKPAGITSRDVVNRVDRLLGKSAKAGHAGTLDPLATGVLVVAAGKATRLIEYVQEQAKEYVGTFLLGRESDTEDVQGNVTPLPDSTPRPARSEIEAALPRLVGAIQQRPPAFSALKVQGRRAYDLARRGETVELAERTVQVHELRVREYDYPRLVLEVRCGGGTYVRSLGRDLARSVGSGAVMSELVRTAVGEFRVEEALAYDALTPELLAAHLLPLARAVAHVPRVELSADEVRRCLRGQRLALARPEPALAGFDPAGELAAILTRDGEVFRPAKVLASPK